MVSNELIDRFYPGQRFDGTHLFYSWIREYVCPATSMLNLGAGAEVGRTLRSFKGEVARVVGADISSDIMRNPGLDEAYVYRDVLPFDDETFDVVVSDYVFEHVREPQSFLSEVRRVLKKQCSFFFRTPNLLHYVSLAGCLTPHRLHMLLANRVRGMDAQAHEPWPTYYRLNTRRAIDRAARRAGFSDITMRLIETKPAYLVFHPAAFYAGVAYERLVNRFTFLAPIRANILGRLIK
jgi:SAM-dependent methyltransferase